MILLAIFVFHVSGTLPEIIKGPKDGTYYSGSNILLPCIVINNNYTIWKDKVTGTKIFIGRDKNTIKPKYQNFQISSSEGNYSLIIENANETDGGVYSCHNADQNVTAVITIEMKPILSLYLNGTYAQNDMNHLTAAVGEAIVVSCMGQNFPQNVSLELKFGTNDWTKPPSLQHRNGDYFNTNVIHVHAVSEEDSPVVCRTTGQQNNLQMEAAVNVVYKPKCSILRNGNNVECYCEGNPPVYNYTMLVNGEVKSVNESLSLSDYEPANFSCIGLNSFGTGYSSAKLISNTAGVGVIVFLIGLLVCCTLLLYLFVTTHRKRRRQMIPPNIYDTSLTPSGIQTTEVEETYHASTNKNNRVIDDSCVIYAQVYANAPKEQFVTFEDIKLENQLGKSRHLQRWKGRLNSKREVIVSSPPENASPMTQINWVAFVKRLLDLPKIEYVAKVEGMCIEMGRFYLLQEYVPTGTLREKLKSIMYKSIKRNVEITSTSSVLLQLSSSLVHGIEFIQRQKFYHPGLSSDEVMVSNDTTCKLYKFCTADFVQERIDEIIVETEDGTETGTLPPEAVFNKAYDEESEMWSLAATLWEIFTHGQKAKFSDLKGLTDPFAGGCVLQKPPNLDNDIYNIMTKCWSKQPKSRPKVFQLKHKIDKKIGPRNTKINEDPLQGYELMTVGAKIE